MYDTGCAGAGAGMTMTLVLVGYLLGSIPFALLLGGEEVRRVGSGNLGAANVLRVRRTSIALAVLALDVAKGCAAVLFASGVDAGVTTTAAVGGGAILGHVYPIWLRFKGGKGVATTFGVFTLLSPLAAAFAAGVFGVAVCTTRYISVGSMLAVVSLPGLVYVTHGDVPAFVSAVGAALLVVFRHRANLVRLHAGSEHRLGHGSSEASPR
ncbi:MAG: glycerol-3-phosphate 1-O-acyltransferase PlsY [Acidobacteria bacterium]|nr:glycerol-3-phosphate 1-O-acyltransferase PlsY [Acidobacteriota bacterium]